MNRADVNEAQRRPALGGYGDVDVGRRCGGAQRCAVNGEVEPPVVDVRPVAGVDIGRGVRIKGEQDAGEEAVERRGCGGVVVE